MNKLLLIDLITPFHVKEFKRIIFNFKFLNSFDYLVIAPNELFLDNIEGEVFRYSVSPTSYKSIPSLWSLVKSISKYSVSHNNICLCTPVNFGPFHDLLINKIKISNGFLFEDGISSYLDMSVKNYWIKKIFYSLFFVKNTIIPKKKFFSVDLNFYDTVFTDKVFHAEAVSGHKKIKKLKSYSNNDTNNNLKLETRTYFLSSSSVEYGLQKLSDYNNILYNLTKNIISKRLIVSFHHNEKQIKNKIEIIRKYFDIEEVLPPNIPAEEKIFNGKSNIQLIAPYNSTALSACYQSSLESLILYNDNGPNIERRVKLFKKILPLFNFRSNFL